MRVWPCGLLFVAGCAAPAPAVAPQPVRVAQVATQAPPPPSTTAVITGAPLEAATVEPLKEAKKEPVLHVDAERPFRLDLRVVPKDHAEFLVDLHDRERWNKGDLGELREALPPVVGHPAPKVIVDVTSARGGLEAQVVQREARRLFWIRVVGCYGTGAYKDQTLRGKTHMRFQVSRAGKVTSAKILDTTLKDREVASCFADQIKKLPLPSGRAGTTVATEIQVGPGDEPMPPPNDHITPGDGTIDPEAVRAVVVGATPELEACYRSALAYAPNLWGRLGIRVHLTEKGKLDEAFEAESRFPDERVSLCALRIVRKLAFPKPAGGDVRFVTALRFHTDAAP